MLVVELVCKQHILFYNTNYTQAYYIFKSSLKHCEPPKIIYLKIKHIFKSCKIYLKAERFCKSKFTLSKLKSEFQNNKY